MWVTMVLCFALSISAAVSIGMAAIFGIYVGNVNMLVSVNEMFSSINKFPLAAIPFFILAGNLMQTGGISKRLGEFAKNLVYGRAGRLADDLRVDLHDFCGGVGLIRSHNFCHRRDLDSGIDQTRLSDGVGSGVAGDKR